MKALLAIAFLGLSLVVSIAVMIHGWGIEPQNWLWIIGGYLSAVILHGISLAISQLD
ncbi:hypothetical protein [Oceaniradius stylonematis]|uniref:hypothetical protein n=1 Tax=Oceaniradius stylonematis TaxID=2184161 RepID=UPI00273E66A1|nr:hypothetical protein [Oceaniradius stylonematis]